MTIHEDDTKYIEKFSFNEQVNYKLAVIHIKDNSLLYLSRRFSPKPFTYNDNAVQDFQDNFFKNGTFPGLVLKSPNTLSEKIKERMIQSWSAHYKPDAGGRRLILDGGIEIDKVSNINFKMTFKQQSQKTKDCAKSSWCSTYYVGLR